MDNPYSTTGYSRPSHRAFQEGYLQALKAIQEKQIPEDTRELERLIQEAERNLLPRRI